MHLRPFDPTDLPELIELTIDTFGPFYEDAFRPAVSEAIFRHQHGNWREDYRAEVPTLHDPDQDKFVAVADHDGAIAGYVGWKVEEAKRHGEVYIVAVAADHRRRGLGTALCEHAFAQMRARGVEVVGIGTGGDAFHAPARALYERLGCTYFPAAIYFKEL
jgi:ribosomal protein S18 acetylase RimI-like enzyme